MQKLAGAISAYRRLGERGHQLAKKDAKRVNLLLRSPSAADGRP